MNASSPILPFGKYKGVTIDTTPDDYIVWLVNTAATAKNGFPANIVAAAKARLADIEKQKITLDIAKNAFRGVDRGPDAPILFIIEQDEISPAFESLDAALANLASEYPITNGERDAPDPEDTRILVWEILPTGHRKVVWQFCGWHYSLDDHACGQGALPGDDATLYSIANSY